MSPNPQNITFLKGLSHDAGKRARKTREYGSNMDIAAANWLAKNGLNPWTKEGNVAQVAFILGWRNR